MAHLQAQLICSPCGLFSGVDGIASTILLDKLQPFSYVMKVIAIFTPKESEGYHLSPFHLCQIAETIFGKFLIFTF